MRQTLRHHARNQAMKRAIQGDRLWFELHPWATVRFRRERKGEFLSLEESGETIPKFTPSGFKPDAPLHWVAVVDLMRLLKEHPSPRGERLRTRVRTVALRSKKHQDLAARELTKAIAHELLTLLGHTEVTIVAPAKGRQAA